MKKIIVLQIVFLALTASAAKIKSGKAVEGAVELEIEYRGTSAVEHNFSIDRGQGLKVIPPIYDDAQLIEDRMGDTGTDIIHKTIRIDTDEIMSGATVILHGDENSIFKFEVI